MKKFLVLLLCIFCLCSVVNAQWSYKLSDSRKNVSKIVPLEKIVNSESKQYSAKMMKKINSLIWVYLKNWDSAFRNWNYSLAIKNYELAIKNLNGVRWAEYFIKKIEQKIEEIKNLNPVSKSGRINPSVSNRSSSSSRISRNSHTRR